MLTTGKVKLYNIVDDPDEKVDLAEKEPELRRKLLERLQAAIEQGSSGYRAKVEAADLDDATKESLKALGYLK
ncbi:MAG: hypothetical protein Kow0099_32900 [Candidatus Abyssubacteria bacterium]